MTWFTETGVLHALQILAIVIAFIQYKILDKGSKIFLIYLILSLFFEALATYTAIHYHNNLLVINIFDVLQYVITCIYFSYSISSLTRKRTTILITVGIIVWLLTSWYKPITSTLNTYFLAFESISIIGLCHYYFYDLLNADDNKSANASFFLVSLLFIFWSFTFMYWLFGLTLRTSMADSGKWLGMLIMIINLVCYSGFSLVFLFYKKLQNVERS